MTNTDFLLIGKKGFLGSFIYNMFIEDNVKFICLNDRLEDPTIYKKIKVHNPKYIICAAGIVGKPNRDWCIINPNETIDTNILCYYNLCNFCRDNDIKILFFGSIGIYNSINDKIFDEDDNPNNLNHIYLFSKYTFERLVKEYKNVIILRLGHCLSLKSNKKNLLTKIINFKSVHNKKMSITVLEQLFKFIPQILKNNNGIINFVSPGYISLYDIVNIYKKVFNKNNHIKLTNYNYDKHREISLVKSKYLNIELINVYKYLNNNMYRYNE